MAEFIELLSDQAIKEIKTLVDAIAKGANNVEELSKKFKQIKLPSETLKELQTLSSETAKLNAVEKESARINKALVSQQAKYAAATSDTNRDLQKLRSETNKLNREHRVAEGLYARVSAAVNKVSQRYNDLALRKELNGKLTNKEATELDRLQQKLSKYQTALKKVDANIGRYSRNVGNYASGWNGLSNSINQLTREAPAFANSMQTGFMALSNNIPILIDEIDVLRRKNMLLAKEGKATKSVFGTVASAFFSWQTALSVGVTLLTLYGAELITWIGSLNKASFGLESAKENLREFNKVLETSLGTIQSEITVMQSLIDIVQDETESREKRNDAVEILQKKYPDYLENLSLENANTIAIKESTDALIKSLEAKAKFQAAEQILQEKAQKFYEEQAKAEQEFAENRENVYEKIFSRFDISSLDDATDEQLKQIRRLFGGQLAMIERERRESFTAAEQDFDDFSEFLRNLIKETPDLEDIFDLGGSGSGRRGSRGLAEMFDLESQGLDLENTIAYFEDQIKLLKQVQKETSKGSNEYQAFAKQIQFAEERLEALKWVFEGMELHADFTIPTLASEFDKLAESIKKAFDNNLLIEQLTRLTKQLNMDINVLVNSFETLSNPNSEDWEKKAALARGSYQIINGIAQTVAQNEQTRIQNQIVLNREYYQEQIRLAEGNQAQQDFLREERDAKERRLRIKQAKAEREAVLFEIAINTASAIVQALPNIGLSIAVGAIGALQAALVKGAPLPQFKHGRKGGEETWAILGDGYKNEPIVDKQGNLKAISPNRPTMMHLDKGDSVLPDMNKLNDEILSKTMLLNVQASANKMTKNNQNKGLERMLQAQSSQVSKGVIKALKKAKFVNVNNTKVDLGFHAKLNKYKGR